MNMDSEADIIASMFDGQVAQFQEKDDSNSSSGCPIMEKNTENKKQSRAPKYAL